MNSPLRFLLAFAVVVLGPWFAPPSRTAVVETLSVTPAWTMVGTHFNEQLGYSAASAGDVNGDGYADTIVGAIGSRCGEVPSSGCAFLYLGSASGPSTTPDWTAHVTSIDDVFGSAVASAGDVNADGYDDVIAGALHSGPTHAGRAYVYLGSPSGLASLPTWVTPDLDPSQGEASLGAAVASAGDVNGDGYADIVAGAPDFSGPHAAEGKVFVFYGSSGGPSTTTSWTEEGNATGARFGGSLASADVNGDGYSDLLIGAEGSRNGQSGKGGGSVFLYLGSPAGLGRKAALELRGDTMRGFFGRSVSSADVNGDGYSDVIVGDPGWNGSEGRAWVYLGSASGLSSSAAWIATGQQPGGSFGDCVSTAGDTNGDGFADVVIGAPAMPTGITHTRAVLYLGSASGLSTTPAWIVEGNPQNEFFGRPVATAGDVNGDGLDDVLVGASGYSGVFQFQGRAALYLGIP